MADTLSAFLVSLWVPWHNHHGHGTITWGFVTFELDIQEWRYSHRQIRETEAQGAFSDGWMNRGSRMKE